MTPTISVVIPAHNEQRSLRHCLTSLASSEGAQNAEVIVVANGCTDETAEVARRFGDRLPGLVVLETEVPSKVEALNLGDAAATAFPRVYLDADIVLSPDALAGLREALSGTEPRVAAPTIVFDRTGSDRGVRSFYRVFERLPYVAEGLVGLGLYAVSESGRRRFGAFPDLIADDLYVQRLFAPDERCVARGSFTVRTPRRWVDLVKVRARIARGNRELASTELAEIDTSEATASTVRALLRLLARHPAEMMHILVYVLTWLSARRRVRAGVRWERDESTRGDRRTVIIDGLPFTRLTEAGVVREVFHELEAGRGGLIVTPNVDIAARVQSEGLHELVQDAHIVTADGMPLVWASRILNDPLPEPVAGSDLVWSLSRTAAKRNRRVFLLGAADGVGHAAAARLAERFPGLEVVGVHTPPCGVEEDPEALDELVARVAEANPDLVFVALGFPKQELVSRVLFQRHPTAWYLGCGGSLDMAAGTLPRAHPVLRRWGAEWLHRLAVRPRRLVRRYVLVDLPYAVGLLVRSLFRRTTALFWSPS